MTKNKKEETTQDKIAGALGVDDTNLEPGQITDKLSQPSKVKSKVETRGRKKKVDVQAEKQKELELSKDIARKTIPVLIDSLENLAYRKINNPDFKRDLKLKPDEQKGLTESFLIVAEKRNWLDISGSPEFMLAFMVSTLVLSRIEVIRTYNPEAFKPKKKSKPIRVDVDDKLKEPIKADQPANN